MIQILSMTENIVFLTPHLTLLKFGEERLILVVGALGEWRDGRTEEGEGV